MENCRACMKIPKISFEFSKNFIQNKNIKIGDIFYRISRVKPNDNFSQKLCLKCLNELASCYEFQQKCIHSDQEFRKTVNNFHPIAEDPLCVKQEKEFNTDEDLVDSIILEDSFECKTCNQLFGDNSTCICDQSNIEKSDDTLTLTHKQENHDPRSYKCIHCPKKFTNKVSRAAHMWRHKNDKIKKTSTDISKNDLLVETDDETDLQNDQYDDLIKQENHQDSMNQEVNNSKSIIESYQCLHCPKKFANKNSRAAHMWRHKYDKINETCKDISENDLLVETEDENYHDSMNQEDNSKSIGEFYKCIHCPKIFYNLPSRAAHMWRHKKEEINKSCEDISNKNLLAKTNEMDLPIDEHDDDEDVIENDDNFKRKPRKSFICDYCGISCDRKTRLEKHKKQHNPEGKPFECEICKIRFATKHRLNEHEPRHIKEEKKIAKKSKKELLLVRQIAKNAALKSQRSIERKQTYKCQFCPEKFTAITNLIRHFGMNLHDDQPQFNCAICSECFEFKKEMIEHLQWHITKRKISCRICKKSFTERCLLKSHMRSHNNERRHLCAECGLGFKTATNLRGHMILHTGEKPFKCKQCTAKFACRGSLYTHQLLHTKLRAFSCELCSSKFTRAYSLKKHMLIHTGERPFECTTCPMRFRSSDVRNRHMLIHTGEKPHVCKFCNRAFTQKNDLTKHLKSHLGEKMYKCDKCPESFRLQLELREHLYEHYRLEKEGGEIEN